MKGKHASVLAALSELVRSARRRKFMQFNMSMLPWYLFTMCLLVWNSQQYIESLIIAIGAILVAQIFCLFSTGYRRISLSNVLLHLNRQYPQLEESAELLLPLTKPWSVLQVLQKQKVLIEMETLLAKPFSQLLPGHQYRTGFINLVMAAGLLLAAVLINSLTLSNRTGVGSSPPVAGVLSVLSAELGIISPQYTAKAARYQQDLNVQLLAGSIVEWRLTFSDPDKTYSLKFADGTQTQMQKQNLNQFYLKQHIQFSGVYHIVADEERLDGIYTLAVTQDNAPRIHVVEPKNTITEIPKNALPRLQTEVRISDDFGLVKVEILASIAKGSGEAVKFRDQVFTFDRSEKKGDETTYYKAWDLAELGMEPGDELYFTVKATDNRQPNPQLSRSQTKIIRWLEDDRERILSDGILIDFMPEYFKSQRQIIIETVQLIEDKAALDDGTYSETSRSLGFSQNDLKQKYGQYLGDEFDDGGGTQQMEDGLGTPELTIHDSKEGDPHHDDDDNHVAETAAQGGHEHGEHEGEKTSSKDKSGYSQVIEKFGHAHGDSDIGVMGQQSPKALMKLAIANMWQAELHLMLTEPELALPYENEALTYLNRARKAERVYVKRLGFEPPPVTEKRRYQGDLSDILSFQEVQQGYQQNGENDDIEQILNLLNLPNQQQQFNGRERTLVTRVKGRFFEMAQQRPLLIKQVATLERLELANSLSLEDCEECLSSLNATLWKLLAEPVARPLTRTESYSDSQPSVSAYSTFLSKRKKVIEATDSESRK